MELEEPTLIREALKICSDHSDEVREHGRGREERRARDPCGEHDEGSFVRALDMGVLKSDLTSKRLSWLQSQIIGADATFGSPFGLRKLTYADHTASGRALRYIEDFIVSHILPFYGNTHTCDSHVGQLTTKTAREASEYIKTCLGGTRDDALLLCGSGTTAAVKRLQEAIGIAVPSIHRQKLSQCLAEEERWVVLVGPHEHHSNLLSWRQSLAEVVEVGMDQKGLIDIESLRLRLETCRERSPKRRILGSFSACSNVTGICSDTREIARLVHRYGGYVCFDFAASGPYVEIDMRSGEADGYDAVFMSPHKFLGGPGSPGVLLMSKRLYQLTNSAPSTPGGGTVCYVNGFDEGLTLYVDDIEEREMGGTPPIIQTIRAALAFRVKEYIGYDAIEKRERFYIQEALERLLKNPNIKILGNTTAKRQAILSFLVITTTSSGAEEVEGNEKTTKKNNLLDLWRETGDQRDKPLHGPFVATLLNDLFGVQARGGCACAGPYGHVLLGISKAHSLDLRSAIQKGFIGVKPGWARVSFPYYMSKEEFDFILDTLEFMAVYGQRFLPLYDFNFRTGTWALRNEALQELLGKENISSNSLRLPGFSKDKAFALHLRTAKQIASLLPKFPSPRPLPEDISPDLLDFRV